MKKRLLTVVLTSVFILGGVATPSFASGIDMGSTNEMYATKGTVGPSLVRYRTDINSALGNNRNIFYSTGNNSFCKFTFGDTDKDDKFYNIDGAADIELSEVTWTNYWHEEAAEVYLVNPVIKTSGENQAYEGRDIELNGNSDNLYFAGVAFNKRVAQNGTIGKYIEYEEDRFKEILENKGISNKNIQRGFVGSSIRTEGNIEVTCFNLPEEVVSAEGIVLVDITGKVNSEFYQDNSKFNDDGFDLASIKVWGKEEITTSHSNEFDKVTPGQAKDTYIIKDSDGEEVGKIKVKYSKTNATIEISYLDLKDGVDINSVSIKKNSEWQSVGFNEIINLKDYINGKQFTMKVDFTITK